MAHLIECPECKKQLQVPEDLIGKKVQCPECTHSFVAQALDTEGVSTTPSKRSGPSSAPKSSARGKKNTDDEDDGEEKSRRRDEDDDMDDERPSRRSRRERSVYKPHFTPHRGGMILAFGIVALVSYAVFPLLAIVFGPIAWLMGNTDLKEIKAGRMDPEGEGQTQTGRILGMVATIIALVSIVIACGFLVVYFCIFALFFGAVAANANKNFPPPPRR